MFCVMPLSPLLCLSGSGRLKDGFLSRAEQTEEILSGRQGTLCKCRKILSLISLIKFSRFPCRLKVSREEERSGQEK